MNEWMKVRWEPDHGRLWMPSKEMEEVLQRVEALIPILERHI